MNTITWLPFFVNEEKRFLWKAFLNDPDPAAIRTAPIDFSGFRKIAGLANDFFKWYDREKTFEGYYRIAGDTDHEGLERKTILFF